MQNAVTTLVQPRIPSRTTASSTSSVGYRPRYRAELAAFRTAAATTPSRRITWAIPAMVASGSLARPITRTAVSDMVGKDSIRPRSRMASGSIGGSGAIARASLAKARKNMRRPGGGNNGPRPRIEHDPGK